MTIGSRPTQRWVTVAMISEHHISLSELLTWNVCQRRHHLAYALNLRSRERPPALGSGSAVHAALAILLSGDAPEKPSTSLMESVVRGCLSDEFGGDETKYGRYVKGAINALSLVPDWVWERTWQVETPIDIGRIIIGDDTWLVHGRTDVWSITDEGVDLLDFKVSEASALDLLLWSPQIRYYALGLQALHPYRAVWYKYLLLPTQGKRAGDPFAWPFTQDAAVRTALDLGKLVGDYAAYQHSLLGATVPPPSSWLWDMARPAYDRSACGYCDFKKVCTAVITGADKDAVIKEEYHEIPRHAH